MKTMENEDESKAFAALAFDLICSGRCEEALAELLEEADRPEACQMLMLLASDRDYLSQLSERQVRSVHAQKRYAGKAAVQFLYCRWLQEVKGDEAGRSEAEGLLRTMVFEFPEALAALAALIRHHPECEETRELYRQYLGKALKKGSVLAFYYRQRDVIAETEDKTVLETAVRALKKRIKDQKDWPYGIYFQLLGQAYEKMDQQGEAVKSYKRALTLGHFSAKADLILLEI